MAEICSSRTDARLLALEVRVEERDRRYTDRFDAQEKATALALATFPTKQDITTLIERVTRAEGQRGGTGTTWQAVATIGALLIAGAALVVSVLA